MSSIKPSDPNAEPPLPPANSTAPASPTGRPTPSKSPGGSAPTGTMTVTGVVTPGVEPNCLLIDNYLLVNGPRDQLRSGARVTVTGRLQPGLMTTCQQGTPLLVESVRPA
ncbi:hypothetical protein ACI2K4_21425 [Micromonospora sp. NPDC050397]|uniref:hypothetical protein n=1 Tax=Micromonospora sp. NPDC050397 TaxID=3364279 RepID=UPI00384E4424